MESRLDSWNAADRTWESLPPPPRSRALGAMVCVDDQLYLMGGIGADNSPMREIDIFNFKTRQWNSSSAKDPLPSRTAAVALGEEIYLIGGIQFETHDPDPVHSRRVDCFNARTHAWTRRADLLTGRHGHAAAVFNNRIYVSGGETNSGQSKSVEVYDPVGNRWQAGPSLQRSRAFHGMAAVADHLMVFGTRGVDHVMEILDPAANRWIDGPAMPLERNRFAWGVVDNRLYVIDGEDDHGRTPATMQMFDGKANQWVVIEPDQRGTSTRPAAQNDVSPMRNGSRRR